MTRVKPQQSTGHGAVAVQTGVVGFLRAHRRARGQHFFHGTFANQFMGNISGVSPTATDGANKKAASQSPLVKPLMKKTMGTITAAKRMSSELTLLTPAWKALGVVSVAVACAASAPK